MRHIFKTLLVLLLVLGMTTPGIAEVITCSQNDCYLVNQLEGKLIIGTKGDFDLELLTGQDSTATGITIGATTGDVVPIADGAVDLGTSSLEFQDIHIDGTANIDALSTSWSVVAGANTACSTTCTGACVFGVNTASATADIVNCADATADECLCNE